MILRLAFVVAIGATQVQTQLPVFRGTADAVTVDVSVRDGRRPVQGLTAADFEVVDNGVLQAVHEVSRENLPLDVSLLIDVSHSVNDSVDQQTANLGWPGGPVPRLDGMTRGIGVVSRALRPADRLQVLNFAMSVRAVPPVRVPPALRLPAGDEFAGRTAFLDALVTALIVPTQSGRRRLIVAFTDARDTASVIDDATQRAVTERSDAVVHVVAVGRRDVPLPAWGPQPTLGMGWLFAYGSYDAFLRELVARTGGRLIVSESGQDYSAALTEAIDEFRTRYVLRYTPRDVSRTGWHTLIVSVKGKKKYDVVARRGYFRGESDN
jgi:hypothetical protein